MYSVIAYGVLIDNVVCAKTPEAVKKRTVAERKERMVAGRRWDGQGNLGKRAGEKSLGKLR